MRMYHARQSKKFNYYQDLLAGGRIRKITPMSILKRLGYGDVYDQAPPPPRCEQQLNSWPHDDDPRMTKILFSAAIISQLASTPAKRRA